MTSHFLPFSSTDDSPCLNELLRCVTGDLFVTSPCCDLDIRGCKPQTIAFFWNAQGVPQIFCKKHNDGFRKTPRNCGHWENWAKSHFEFFEIRRVHNELYLSVNRSRAEALTWDTANQIKATQFWGESKIGVPGEKTQSKPE